MFDILADEDNFTKAVKEIDVRILSLVALLTEKGIFTLEEYTSQMEAYRTQVEELHEKLKKEAEEKFKADYPTLANLFSRE